MQIFISEKKNLLLNSALVVCTVCQQEDEDLTEPVLTSCNDTYCWYAVSLSEFCYVWINSGLVYLKQLKNLGISSVLPAPLL